MLNETLVILIIDQFENSLSIDLTHLSTWLYLGIDVVKII